MQQFQSLQRLLTFYAMTLLVMLGLYYFNMFYGIKKHGEQHSVDTFYLLQHKVTSGDELLNRDIKEILDNPAFKDTSYQLIFITPSGQTYIHRHARPGEPAFATVTFPTITPSSANSGSYSAHTLNNNNVTGTIKLKSGHQIYLILRHEPFAIDWISYHYWLPLMIAIIFLITALLYILSRQNSWNQLLAYSDNLSGHAKDAYTPPPFSPKKSATEFLRLGHALSRVSYQLHSDYHRIRTLTHRLERLVEQAPLPMLMIMRHGQISFFNQRFEQLFDSSSQQDESYELTDFFAGKDEFTQLLLQTLSNLRITRTLTVYSLENQQIYQLHITPWFGEHGQVHNFTVILNNINEFTTQIAQLQQQNQKLQQKLDELATLRSLVGYQLRVPLETMIDTLEPINPKTLSYKQHDILKTLIKSSQSMLTTLNDTLDIGEVEVRKARLSSEPVDIYKLSRGVNDLILDDIRQQGLELIYFFAPDCPRCIDTDAVRLRQILLNLLNNASKFTILGYIALTIDRVTHEQITQINSDYLLPTNKNMRVSQSSHWVRFSIKDTGGGIAIDKQNQLRTDVHQSNRQTHSKMAQNIDATGIGLNNANSFAQLLGGFIELQSTIGNGSTFNLYLPCRHPNYQPVYHRSQHLTHIHLIAVVNQALVAKHLQHLCEYLSISTTIYTSVDLATVQQLASQLVQVEQTLAPVLLLDYEYYDAVTFALSSPLLSKDGDLSHSEMKELELENQVFTNHEKQQALDKLLAHSSLPKILFSIKPERRIPSVLLDKYDGFLTKPLDANLLLSELLRLTLPARKKLVQTASFRNNSRHLAKEANKLASETTSPLVLVVEDSPTNQKITCKILSKLGYRSVVAEDGQQALDKLQEQRQDISLILMDCRMPVMDGLQATQAIRAQGDAIPIVALTANNTSEDREACLLVGMDEFLSKPINKEALEAVLQRLIKLS
ncbi:response regulator [Psychrobacter sp. CCUG 69069]|uniref:histidine kinase n=1 Tax=Psychrobacter namhaensis TaxID=292734 RepID=A0ABW8L7Z5_9GAMM|nr:response regulator [Psychrobacter sp. CCUG 69069]MCD1279874.1 response regulator [Psychrobacter sp. CCUG 69069]